MDSIRVVHVMPSIDAAYGGPVAAIVGLAGAQARAGMRISVLATYRSGDELSNVDELRAQGVEVEMVGPTIGPIQWRPGIGRAATAAVAQHDIVHIHTVWEQIQHVAATAARRAGKPYIFRPCGMLDPWCLNQGRLKKKLYLEARLRKDLNAAAALHFTTDIERDLVAPLGLKPPAIVEPNGVRLEEFETLPPRGAFRSKHPQIDEKRLIVFMSRVHPKKGLDLLIPAFTRVDRPDVALAIVGPGVEPYVASIQREIERHGIADRVVMPGMLKGADRIAALRDADLFVLPSYQENFGVVVVEALAAGTPVIISDQVNIYREIESAGVGQAVSTEVEPLADAIAAWIADDAKRAEAGERCRPFVRGRYDWNEIARRWSDHYGRLLGAGGAAK